MSVVDENGCKEIDQALRHWRQGDCVLGAHWFLFRLNTDAPLTEEASAAADVGADAGEAEVRGLMVATQTCDLVRDCEERPFVETCPLIEVDARKMKDIERGRRPRYAHIPGVADRQLVADLDRVMTVEKAVVAKWTRQPGCKSDADFRRLALALSRKRARFAFPDEFNRLASNLKGHLSGKHGKNTDAGRALRALREIRVRAAPEWDDDSVALTFWFIRGADEPHFEGQGWDSHLDTWMGFLAAGGRFTTIDGAIQTLDDLTANDYVESDPLDLDHLSP